MAHYPKPLNTLDEVHAGENCATILIAGWNCWTSTATKAQERIPEMKKPER